MLSNDCGWTDRTHHKTSSLFLDFYKKNLKFKSTEIHTNEKSNPKKIDTKKRKAIDVDHSLVIIQKYANIL